MVTNIMQLFGTVLMSRSLVHFYNILPKMQQWCPLLKGPSDLLVNAPVFFHHFSFILRFQPRNVQSIENVAKTADIQAV